MPVLHKNRHRSPIQSSHPHSFSDRDLENRSEHEAASSLDARIVSNSWGDVRDYLSDARIRSVRQWSVARPVLHQMLLVVLAQFSTLSRISARPAALAKSASANTIRSQPLIVRVGLIPLASLFIAVGVASQITAGLGLGPGDMIVSGLSVKTGLTFGSCVLILSGCLGAVATVLGRAPRIGTILNVAMIGPLIDVVLPWVEFEGGFGARVLLFSVGLWSIGIGIGCLMHARLGIGTHEAFSLAISDHTGIPARKVRTGQEIAWIVLGLLLGSQFGIGTVAVALFIGPAITAGARSVGRVLTTFSAAMQAPEVAAHVDNVGF